MIYQVGGSLESQAPCYVERKADHDLYNALQAGELCYILNSRQVGKSSLLVRTFDRLQHAGFICTKLDITSIGSEDITPLQWYKGIIVDLLRSLQLFPQFPLKTWWEEREDLPLIQRLAQFLEEVLLVQFPEQKIVIFLDEIDSILSLPFPVDDFWALIRFFFNQRAVNPEYKRLIFALFGVATPADLIQDHRRTPFNIGRAIELTGFTLAESTPLIQGLTPLPWHAPTLYQAILDWTSGQPFLTQKICQLSLQFYSHFSEENEVDFIRHLIKQKIISNWEFQDEPEHLKTIKNRLIYSREKTVKILGIYQQILQEKSIEADKSLEKITLILSGLLENNQGKLKIKNQIYQAIFDLQWVTKELTNFRPHSQNLQDWLISNKLDESRLLRGKSLKEAQNWAEGKSLSDADYQFLAASVEWENRELQKALQLRQQKKVAHLQSLLLLVMTSGLLVSSFLSFVTFKQYQEVRISEIKALLSSSQGLFASHQHLKSLLEAVKAQRKWQDLRIQNPRLQKQLDRTLSQAVYGADEINHLSGHKGGVLSVDFSRDGQLIATASNDKTVKIWDKHGQLINTFSHQDTVHRVVFSNDSQLVATAVLNGNIYLWQKDGRLLLKISAHQAPVWGVAISPDWQTLASASGDRTVKLWNRQGQLLRTLAGHTASVWNVTFSEDGQTLASAGVDGLIHLWNLQGKKRQTLQGHQSSIWDITFCPQTEVWASVSADKTLRLWDKEGKLLWTRPTGDNDGIGVDCSDNGKVVASSGADNIIRLWRTDGSLLKILQGHQSIIRDIALSPEGEQVVSASDEGVARLWQVDNSLNQTLQGHRGIIWTVSISPNSEYIASASSQEEIKIWHRSGRLVQTLSVPPSSASTEVYFSPDGQNLLSGGRDGLLRIWHLIEGRAVSEQPQEVLTQHRAIIFSLVIRPDLSRMASGSDDNRIKLWSQEGKLIKSVLAHRSRVWHLATSRDGKLLASASEDGTAKLWNWNGTLLQTLTHDQAVWGVAISPDGQIIASSSRDDTLKLWQRDGTPIKTVKGESRGLTRVAFSADGKMIATGGVDNTVKLWSKEGELIRTLIGHKGMVLDVAFSPDSSYLVSAGDDQKLIIWDLGLVSNLQLFDFACTWLKHYLAYSAEATERDRQWCAGNQASTVKPFR